MIMYFIKIQVIFILEFIIEKQPAFDLLIQLLNTSTFLSR